MTRRLIGAAAQMGPISRNETRESCVRRMSEMMREAAAKGARFIVFPELALTSFFPRWVIDDRAELDQWYEDQMPNPVVKPLFDLATELGVGFNFGYAEKIIEDGKTRYFNTAILVDASGHICGKYRKVHLPGHKEPQPGRHHQHLEKRYFEQGNLGFPVTPMMDCRMGMLICNDRRWPEGWRVLALQAAELVCLGYNTPNDHSGFAEVDALADFHHVLSMQSGSYLNSVWSIASAKCGNEEGSSMIGNSVIVAPSGEVIAQSETLEDEVICADMDLDMATQYRQTFFDFARHRAPECYGLITHRKGSSPDPDDS